jgi:hypothetical protein
VRVLWSSPVVVLFMQAFQVKNPKSSIALWGVPRYTWPVWVSFSCSFGDFFPQLSGTGSHPPVPLFVLASSTSRYPFWGFSQLGQAIIRWFRCLLCQFTFTYVFRSSLPE